jgi:hypothetical protein
MALSTGTNLPCSYPEALYIYRYISWYEMRWLNGFISYFSTHQEGKEGMKRRKKNEF